MKGFRMPQPLVNVLASLPVILFIPRHIPSLLRLGKQQGRSLIPQVYDRCHLVVYMP